MGDLLSSPFTYSVIYLCQDELIDFFILWVIIWCYYFILFQPWPLGALSLGSCIPLTYYHHVCAHTCVCVHKLLLSGIARCSMLILFISCSSPRISHFCKEPWLLLLENGIRSQDVGAKYACFHWDAIASRPSQLTEQGDICIYTNLYYTYL